MRVHLVVHEAVEEHHFDGRLAFDLQLFAGRSGAVVGDDLPRGGGEVDAAGDAVAFHAGGGVDGVALQIEEVLASADHAADDVTVVDANAEIPTGRQRTGGRDHFEAAVHTGEDRVLDRFEQVAGSHEGVADRGAVIVNSSAGS